MVVVVDVPVESAELVSIVEEDSAPLSAHAAKENNKRKHKRMPISFRMISLLLVKR